MAVQCNAGLLVSISCSVPSCRNVTTPKLIEALSGKQVVCISAGTGYSAAVAGGGALYTWGRGSLGRLGHGE